MNGLNLEQEAALVYAWMNQNAGVKNFTELGTSEAFIALKTQGMIQMQTDWGHSLVMFQSMLPAGVEHYSKARKARRWFKTLSDEADCLMLRLAAQDAAKRKSEDEPIFVATDFDKDTYYAELSRCGLLDVKWADNSPYLVAVTDMGRTYANGWLRTAGYKDHDSTFCRPRSKPHRPVMHGAPTTRAPCQSLAQDHSQPSSAMRLRMDSLPSMCIILELYTTRSMTASASAPSPMRSCQPDGPYCEQSISDPLR